MLRLNFYVGRLSLRRKTVNRACLSARGLTRLTSDHIALEPLCVEHASVLFEPLSDLIIYQHIPDEPPASPEALKDRFRHLEQRQSPDGSELWLNWAINDVRRRTYVGYIQATVVGCNAELAYVLTSSAWGYGIATASCQLVLGYLRHGCAVSSVEAQTDTRNIRSIQLLRRLGFKELKRTMVVLRGNQREDLVFFKTLS